MFVAKRSASIVLCERPDSKADEQLAFLNTVCMITWHSCVSYAIGVPKVFESLVEEQRVMLRKESKSEQFRD